MLLYLLGSVTAALFFSLLFVLACLKNSSAQLSDTKYKLRDTGDAFNNLKARHIERVLELKAEHEKAMAELKRPVNFVLNEPLMLKMAAHLEAAMVVLHESENGFKN